MNTYIVIITNVGFLSDIVAKLKNYPYYFIMDNICIIHSEKVKSKDIFDELVGNDQSKNVIVFKIGQEAPKDYWGYGDKVLWEWLAKKQ